MQHESCAGSHMTDTNMEAEVKATPRYSNYQRLKLTLPRTRALRARHLKQ